MSSTTRVVVGGGLFGCYAALVLAHRGHRVQLLEAGPDLLTRASLVNQARLHTGLHYPRSILTAMEALGHYRAFRARFAEAVRDFHQIYAVSARNSKTTGEDFASFVDRLGMPAEEIDPNRWFHKGRVARAFHVEEPAFDASVLRTIIAKELQDQPNVTVRLNTAVTGGSALPEGVRLDVVDGTSIDTEGVVLATYAGTNAVRRSLGLKPLPLTFELAEVILGQVTAELQDYGFTVMDGPFWSLMPFGHTGRVSLTGVGLTPLRRARDEPRFACQDFRADCAPSHLSDCTSCPVRPMSSAVHQQQQMGMFLKHGSAFTPTGSLLTVKAILTATEVDDARPTLVQKEAGLNVWTVFSGKVSTLFDLDAGLS